MEQFPAVRLALAMVGTLVALWVVSAVQADHAPRHRERTSTPEASRTPRIRATATATSHAKAPAIVPQANANGNGGNSNGNSQSLLSSEIPTCQAHSVTAWHSLVERDSSGAILCTYGHEHKDDPSGVDDLFGPAIYGSGHPWATPGENDEQGKHRFYGWQVVRGLACAPASGAQYSLTDFRGLGHWDGHAAHATRFHSFILDAKLCKAGDQSYSGRISTGGHVDYGNLELEGVGAIPQPQDSDPVCGSTDGNSKRTHGTPADPRARFIWYGANGSCSGAGIRVVSLGAFSMLKEEWGPVDPAAPNSPLLFYICPPIGFGCPFNGSHLEPMHSVRFTIPRGADSLDGATDGKLTWSGLTNRYGYRVTACVLGPDCIPFIAQNIIVGVPYSWRRDEHPSLEMREYDVADPETGDSLIVYPN